MKKIMVFAVILISCLGTIFADGGNRKLTYVPIYVSFVPGLPPVFGNRVVANLGISALVGVVYRIRGTQLSSIVSITSENLYGIQVSGIGNIVQGEVNGIQSSGVFNIASRGVVGAQTSGVFNISHGDTTFLQTSGVFNIVDGDFSGMQIAGVFNITKRDVAGVQLAGVFNIADDVNGTQIGLINVADDVQGFQFGLVNISDKIAGIPVGLINITRSGIFQLSVWTDDSGFSFIGFQQGTRHFYLLMYSGMKNDDLLGGFSSSTPLTAGIGFGTRLRAYPFFIDIDLSAKHLAKGETTGDKLLHMFSFTPENIFPSFRFLAGLSVFGDSSIYGGVTLDAHVPSVTTRNLFHTGYPLVAAIADAEIQLFPKLFVGIQM